MKILLDTDIGTDPDDGVALSYLLLREDCELLGVTTVGRESSLRADIVSRFCRHFGRPDVPVEPGADHPYVANRYWWHHLVRQRFILEGRPSGRAASARRALDLMRNSVRDHPGEVVLVSIGPMTNIGLLAAEDPETVSLIKAVYTMTGYFARPEDAAPRTECNTMLDPASAHAAFYRAMPNHHVVPVNVTRGLGIPYPRMIESFAGDRLELLRRFCSADGQKTDGRTGMHDPLTCACLFDHELCTWKRGRVRVELSDTDYARGEKLPDQQQTGRTLFVEDDEGPHWVAVDRDADRFHAHRDAVFAEGR